MTAAEMLLRASPVVKPSATGHLFKVGDRVLMKPSFQYAAASGVYRVTATMPASDGQPQYRLQSDEERYERVAPQDSLTLATASSVSSSGGSRATLIKRAFGRG